MSYWLIKSEPDLYSIADFEEEKVTPWEGVRNYQARNYLCEMAIKDLVLFYHSSCDPAGIVGVGRVHKRAYPDPFQFDSKSEFYDAAVSKKKPRWFCPDFKYVRTFPQIITLEELRKEKALKDMALLQRGSRLSVQPVTEKEFTAIINISKRVIRAAKKH